MPGCASIISTVWDLIKNDILEQARSEFLENSNYEEYQRLAKVFPNWRNFAKSGHTDEQFGRMTLA